MRRWNREVRKTKTPMIARMDWPREQLYARILQRDATFDGAFLVCVTTTGIYCLPSCKARKPLLENVRFLPTEREAKASGFRACRVCQPDLFYRGENRDEELYEALLARARPLIADIPNVPALAELCGVGSSKLNDLFRRHAHGTPGEFLRAARIEQACELLHATDDDVLEIGLATGFESASTFYRQFRDHVGLSPGAFRSVASVDHFALRLPANYDPRPALLHASMDPGGTAERADVGRGVIHKAVSTSDGVLTIEIALGCEAAHCTLHGLGSLSARSRVQAHAAALRMLGLSSRSAEEFEARGVREPQIRSLVGTRSGFRLPQTLTAFEALVWGIVGQQISIRFAAELRRVLIMAANRPAPLGLWAHPTPADVARLEVTDLVRQRYSQSKAAYVIETARVIAEDALDLEALGGGSAEGAQRRLTAIRGIGVWTARYTLLRGARFADFAPVGDSGLAAGLQRIYGLQRRPSVQEAERLMLPFSPHRSIATAHMWAMIHDPFERAIPPPTTKGTVEEEAGEEPRTAHA